jgi:hypothetical protein
MSSSPPVIVVLAVIVPGNEVLGTELVVMVIIIVGLSGMTVGAVEAELCSREDRYTSPAKECRRPPKERSKRLLTHSLLNSH